MPSCPFATISGGLLHHSAAGPPCPLYLALSPKVCCLAFSPSGWPHMASHFAESGLSVVEGQGPFHLNAAGPYQELSYQAEWVVGPWKKCTSCSASQPPLIDPWCGPYPTSYSIQFRIPWSLQRFCAPHSPQMGSCRETSQGTLLSFVSYSCTLAPQPAWPSPYSLNFPYSQKLVEMPPSLMSLLKISPFSCWYVHHVIHSVSWSIISMITLRLRMEGLKGQGQVGTQQALKNACTIQWAFCWISCSIWLIFPSQTVKFNWEFFWVILLVVYIFTHSFIFPVSLRKITYILFFPIQFFPPQYFSFLLSFLMISLSIYNIYV